MELQATLRTVFGKKVRSLRAQGLIPAEVFGRGLENRHIAVPTRDFEKIYKQAGEHTVVTLILGPKEKIPTVIADVARNPLGTKVVSIDFHEVRMDEKIQAKIPVRLVGTAAALKLGFPVLTTLEEIEVEALPGKMPHVFELDITKLERPGESVHVSDIVVPSDVKVLVPADTVIVTVGEKTKEEVVAPPPAPAAAEGAVPPAGAETPAAEAAPEKPAK